MEPGDYRVEQETDGGYWRVTMTDATSDDKRRLQGRRFVTLEGAAEWCYRDMDAENFVTDVWVVDGEKATLYDNL